MTLWPCVQLVADDSLVSEAIQFWSHSQFSHAGFRTQDGAWLDCRLDGGVQIRPAGSYRPTRFATFTFPGIEQAIDYGRELIGRKYDECNILGMVINPALHDPNREICSRFVQECSEHTPFAPILNPAVKCWHVMPGHLLFSPGVTNLQVVPYGLLEKL